jgi:hypothetical protein
MFFPHNTQCRGLTCRSVCPRVKLLLFILPPIGSSDCTAWMGGIMNLKRYIGKRSWRIRSTIPEFAWMDWGKSRQTRQDSQYPGQDFTREYKCRALPLREPARSTMFHMNGMWHRQFASVQYKARTEHKHDQLHASHPLLRMNRIVKSRRIG